MQLYDLWKHKGGRRPQEQHNPSTFFSYAEEERNFTWGHFSYRTVSLKRVFTLLITKTTMTTYWYRNIAREIINSNSSIEKSLSIFQHHIYYLPTYMIVRPTNWMRKFSLSPHNRNRSSLPIQYSLQSLYLWQ